MRSLLSEPKCQHCKVGHLKEETPHHHHLSFFPSTWGRLYERRNIYRTNSKVSLQINPPAQRWENWRNIKWSQVLKLKTTYVNEDVKMAQFAGVFEQCLINIILPIHPLFWKLKLYPRLFKGLNLIGSWIGGSFSIFLIEINEIMKIEKK